MRRRKRNLEIVRILMLVFRNRGGADLIRGHFNIVVDLLLERCVTIFPESVKRFWTLEPGKVQMFLRCPNIITGASLRQIDSTANYLLMPREADVGVGVGPRLDSYPIHRSGAALRDT